MDGGILASERHVLPGGVLEAPGAENRRESDDRRSSLPPPVPGTPNPRVTNHEVPKDTKSSVEEENTDVRGRSGRAATGRASIGF